jgi:hypothetical protein
VLRRRAGQDYGDTAADIREYLRDYSNSSGYLAQHYADPTCPCGHGLFRLALDETQGAAVRTCRRCGAKHAIGDSTEYLADAQLEECACPCGAEVFELTIAVSLYRDSDDVRWLYVGARCARCGLIGCYGDWKNEFQGYKELLTRA